MPFIDWPELVMKQILNVWECRLTAWRQHHGSTEREVSVESGKDSQPAPLLIFSNQIYC